MDNKSSATLVSELRSAVGTAAKINARLSVMRAVLCGEAEAAEQADRTASGLPAAVLIANLRVELSTIHDQMNRLETFIGDLDALPVPESNRASVSGALIGRHL